MLTQFPKLRDFSRESGDFLQDVANISCYIMAGKRSFRCNESTLFRDRNIFRCCIECRIYKMVPVI